MVEAGIYSGKIRRVGHHWREEGLVLSMLFYLNDYNKYIIVRINKDMSFICRKLKDMERIVDLDIGIRNDGVKYLKNLYIKDESKTVIIQSDGVQSIEVI